jgi:thiol-disulfide isomerase/thioredoxin
MKSPLLQPFPSPDLARRHALLATLVGVGALAGCQPRPPIDRPAAFDYTLLDGVARHSAGLQGQVVLVNFWGTRCAICMREMPRLVAIHRQFNPRGLQTLAVAVRDDPPALVASYAQSRALPFDVAIDNTGAIASAFGGVRGTPTSLLLARSRRIVWRHEGELDFDALHARLAALLGAPGPLTA